MLATGSGSTNQSQVSSAPIEGLGHEDWIVFSEIELSLKADALGANKKRDLRVHVR
jgi:hypothetical protein